MKHWIFKYNTDIYRLDLRLDDPEPRMTWSISRYREQIQADDVAFLWQTGKHRGIRAMIRIDSSPQDMPELESEQKYWTPPDTSVRCRVYAMILRRDLDVSADKIRTIAGLEGLSALQAVPAGIFAVTPEEAAILLRAIE
jgi:hypothetical protein